MAPLVLIFWDFSLSRGGGTRQLASDANFLWFQKLHAEQEATREIASVIAGLGIGACGLHFISKRIIWGDERSMENYDAMKTAMGAINSRDLF